MEGFDLRFERKKERSFDEHFQFSTTFPKRKSDFKNGHISRFCFVFQIIEVIP